MIADPKIDNKERVSLVSTDIFKKLDVRYVRGLRIPIPGADDLDAPNPYHTLSRITHCGDMSCSLHAHWKPPGLRPIQGGSDYWPKTIFLTVWELLGKESR
jgi:hypothetical protein